jgi:hypothetical protein
VAGLACREDSRPWGLAQCGLRIVLLTTHSLKGTAMADFKNSRDQSRLEKAAREGGSSWAGYEAEAKLVREKTARLKALRLAKEAAGERAVADKSAKPTKRAMK